LGVILDDAIAYRTVPETTDRTGAVERFRTEGADVITFTSSSTVEHFLDLRIPLPDGLKSPRLARSLRKPSKSMGSMSISKHHSSIYLAW